MRSKTTTGLLVAVSASLAFGLSGTLAKPLLEIGWSPAAAVTARSIIGGAALAVPALIALRGRWSLVWQGRTRILLMALVGVAATQLAYYAAVERIPVSTAILVEYVAPVLLVLLAWATTRRMPRALVLGGSVVAMVGLSLVVSPAGGAFDVLGLAFAAIAAVGCAVYYLVAGRPSEGLPPVVLASAGLLLGGLALGVVGLTGLVPFTVAFGDVDVAGAALPWWIPLIVLGVLSTGFAYAASIAGSELLGSQLASFAGLLEVVAAALYSWLLLGEALTPAQALGGLLILVGIALVKWEPRPRPALLEPEVPALDPEDQTDVSGRAIASTS